MTRNRPMRLALLGLAISVFGATACAEIEPAASDEGAVAPLAQQSTTPPTAAPADSAPIRDPNGVYFGKVTADGSGCPAGAWRASVATDGLAFTLLFDKYAVMVTPENAIQTRNCIVYVRLLTPKGFSYGLTKLTYQGYARLGQDVQLEQRVYYAYTGNGAPSINDGNVPASARKLVGPHDNDFFFYDDVKTTDINWSECGQTRALQLRTILTLTNSTPRRVGEANMISFDGTTQGGLFDTKRSGKIVVDFARRPCTTTGS